MLSSVLYVLLWSLYVLVWLWFLLNKHYYTKMFKYIYDNHTLLFFMSFASFVVWFFLILFYSIFPTASNLLIAAVWLWALLKSILFILFPAQTISFLKDLVNYKKVHVWWYACLAIWALFLIFSIL